MEFPYVIFTPTWIADDDWQITTYRSGGIIEFVTGFKSEADAEAWIKSPQRLQWLKDRGLAA